MNFVSCELVPPGIVRAASRLRRPGPIRLESQKIHPCVIDTGNELLTRYRAHGVAVRRLAGQKRINRSTYITCLVRHFFGIETPEYQNYIIEGLLGHTMVCPVDADFDAILSQISEQDRKDFQPLVDAARRRRSSSSHSNIGDYTPSPLKPLLPPAHGASIVEQASRQSYNGYYHVGRTPKGSWSRTCKYCVLHCRVLVVGS